MILTGSAIRQALIKGDIYIDPFLESNINPNSYNYRLGNKLIIFNSVNNAILKKEVEIPESGFVLRPGTLYLGSTLEAIGSNLYAISLIGRSSIGRLGLHVQLSANLGHTGTLHKWTLELRASKAIRVYPKMVIGQISFWGNKGSIDLYNGLYKKFSYPKEAIIDKLYLDIP